MALADTLEKQFAELIAQELSIRPQQVHAASALFAEKATVPFVARYRKEATGGLDDEVLETLWKRRQYFLDLAERRDAVLASIGEQGKLTPELEARIRAATSKQVLEDLYLPYKPKRRTRAQMARERGLEPLADLLLERAAGADPADDLTADFVTGETRDGEPVPPEELVADAGAALAGARDILAERLAERADHRADLRASIFGRGELSVRVFTGKDKDPAAQVFKDYFDHAEPAESIPSHRLLAILRGENEGFLLSDVAVDDELEIHRLQKSWDVRLDTPCGRQVAEATADGYRRLLRPSITNEVRAQLRERAEAEAIAVFRENLEALLLQSPLGFLPVLGLDPGFRTGCKLALVDANGRVAVTDVIYPVEPASRVDEAKSRLVALAKAHGVHAIAVGNGTGSRETERVARRAMKEAGLDVIVAIVPETGASVYSASKEARDELPDLDVSLRGAVSIARRLQDPMAELVKIDPKSLGVGQYQHDVDQRGLASELDLTVESVVNRVGVELNSASAPLLRRVSGLSDRIARSIVAHRDAEGPFTTRKSLLDVSGFGPKTFEQSAGFLRLRDGEHPLDRTAVHPERYRLVEDMAKELGVTTRELVGNPKLVGSVRFEKFHNEAAGVGRFTLDDIKAELERPGRDPRPSFRAPAWRDDVTSLDDLQLGMRLEGRVSNVTNFGAFVDLGVKRDGLVHLSELSDDWVDDPKKVVKAGQIVKVRVIDIDRDRGRVSLSMRTEAAGPKGGGRPNATPRTGQGQARGQQARDSQNRPRGKKTGGRSGDKSQSQGGPQKPASLKDLAGKFNRRL